MSRAAAVKKSSRFTSINPATGKEIASYDEMERGEVARIIEQANAAFLLAQEELCRTREADEGRGENSARQGERVRPPDGGGDGKAGQRRHRGGAEMRRRLRLFRRERGEVSGA